MFDRVMFLTDFVIDVSSDTATFTMAQFGSQMSFLFLVIVISFALGLSTVQTAQLGQAVSVVWCGLAFLIGWRLLPDAPANHVLEEGRSLLTEGFVQIYHTVKNIQANFRHGLRWYLLGIVFGEAAVNSFTVVSVIYLDEQMGLSSTQIGLFFLVTLFFSLPGSILASIVTKKLDPNRSWQLVMVLMIIVTAGGAMVVETLPNMVAYAWGAVIGVLLGWFYPTENLFFSMCLPKGQEAVRTSAGKVFERVLSLNALLSSIAGAIRILRVLHPNPWLVTATDLHRLGGEWRSSNVRSGFNSFLLPDCDLFFALCRAMAGYTERKRSCMSFLFALIHGTRLESQSCYRAGFVSHHKERKHFVRRIASCRFCPNSSKSHPKSTSPVCLVHGNIIFVFI